jgi:hypothetical protein
MIKEAFVSKLFKTGFIYVPVKIRPLNLKYTWQKDKNKIYIFAKIDKKGKQHRYFYALPPKLTKQSFFKRSLCSFPIKFKPTGQGWCASYTLYKGFDSID